MSERFFRTALLLFGGVALLVPTIASLLPLAAPSDPAEGGEQALRIVDLLSVLLSTAFGSLAMMLFIRAFLVAAHREIHRRKATAAVGAGLMTAGFLLAISTAGEWPAWSGYLMLISLMMWYGGGGALLTAWVKSPTADHPDLTVA